MIFTNRQWFEERPRVQGLVRTGGILVEAIAGLGLRDGDCWALKGRSACLYIHMIIPFTLIDPNIYIFQYIYLYI